MAPEKDPFRKYRRRLYFKAFELELLIGWSRSTIQRFVADNLLEEIRVTVTSHPLYAKADIERLLGRPMF